MTENNSTSSKKKVSLRDKILIDGWEEVKKLGSGESVDIVDIATADKYMLFCTAMYSQLSDEKIELDKRRPFVIEDFREDKEIKSDDRAKRLYEMSDDGQRRIGVEQKLKVLSKLINALDSRINRIKFEYKTIR